MALGMSNLQAMPALPATVVSPGTPLGTTLLHSAPVSLRTTLRKYYTKVSRKHGPWQSPPIGQLIWILEQQLLARTNGIPSAYAQPTRSLCKHLSKDGFERWVSQTSF